MNKKIDQIRAQMAVQKIDAFLIPRSDMFQGENVAPCDDRLKWITGFTGSAGMAIITANKAALFVDGRYTLQAPQQVDTAIFEICKIPENGLSAWIKKNCGAAKTVIGFDATLLTLTHIRAYEKTLNLPNFDLKPVDKNPVDVVWGDDQPSRSCAPIWVHDVVYAGQSTIEKRDAIKRDLKAKKIDGVLITDPESVSWLFNIRGQDVENTPLVHAFAWVSQSGNDILFIDLEKITPEIHHQIGDDVTVHALDKIGDALKEIGAKPITMQLDPKNCPYALYQMVTKTLAVLSESDDPCSLPKACKNAVEIAGAKTAHVIDGVALVKFLHWFDGQVAAGASLDELTVVKKLRTLRAQDDRFVEDSFDTIAGFAGNGAIVHYRATSQTNLPIKGDSLLLLDSGGQYYAGTTDITRTIAVGMPTDEMIDRNTRVLKGMISLSQARFPAGVTGANLDILARRALWEVGLDYAHGTGHGVGSFLGVHEGPQGISLRATTPLKAGMILSNEPGYYKTDEYGIRIENLIVVVDDTHSDDEQPMLAFETLTVAPIDMRLVDRAMLSDKEKQWLIDYHAGVVEKLGEYLSSTEKDWLIKAVS